MVGALASTAVASAIVASPITAPPTSPSRRTTRLAVSPPAIAPTPCTVTKTPAKVGALSKASSSA